MNHYQKGFVIPLIITIIAILAIGGVVYLTPKKKVEAPVVVTPNVPVQNATTTVTDTKNPTITLISPMSGPVGTFIDVKGNNLAGFEGDKNLWIENSNGQKGAIITGGSRYVNSDTNIRFILGTKYCTKDNTYSGLPCESYLNITPGTYSIYAYPLGKMSNKVKFTVTATESEKPVACTMDAMMCPDGSYVGRSGPKCEFVCPISSNSNSLLFLKQLKNDFSLTAEIQKIDDNNVIRYELEIPPNNQDLQIFLDKNIPINQESGNQTERSVYRENNYIGCSDLEKSYVDGKNYLICTDK